VAGFCGRRAPTHRESRGTVFDGQASLTWRDKWQMVWASRSSGADASERPGDGNVMSTDGLPQAAFHLFILARRAIVWKRPQDMANVMNCCCWHLPYGCSSLGTNLAALLQCNPVTPTSAGTRRCDSLPMPPHFV
jgi:hypothetical protein